MKPLRWLMLLVSPLAIAAASVPEASDLVAREDPYIGVYLCPEHDWKPADKCKWKKMDLDENHRGPCFNMSDPANSEKSSFGPDKQVWCNVYTELLCQGKRYLIDYPGAPDLGKMGMSMGNDGAQGSSKFKSFQCGKYKCENGVCTFYNAEDHGGSPSSNKGKD